MTFFSVGIISGLAHCGPLLFGISTGALHLFLSLLFYR